MPNKKEVNSIKTVLKKQRRSQSWLVELLNLNNFYNTVNGWRNKRNQSTLIDLLEVTELLEVAPADWLRPSEMARATNPQQACSADRLCYFQCLTEINFRRRWK